MSHPRPTAHAFLATSLDGFIARDDGSIDWLTSFDTGGADTGYDAFIASVDGVVMGRGTWDTVRAFAPWPYAVPVVVLSHTLSDDDIPEALRPHVTLMSGPPHAILDALGHRGWRRVYVDGGHVVRAFLGAGALHDLVLTIAPVLLGSGRRLFGPLDADLPLTLVHARALPPGFVQAAWTVATRARG